MRWGNHTRVVLLCGSANGLRPPLRSEVGQFIDIGVPVEVVVLGGERDVGGRMRRCIECFPKAVFFLLRGDMLEHDAARTVRTVFERWGTYTQGLRILPLRVSPRALVDCVVADLAFLEADPEDAATPYVVPGTRQVSAADRLPIPTVLDVLAEDHPRSSPRRTGNWLVPALLVASILGVYTLADSAPRTLESVVTAAIDIEPPTPRGLEAEAEAEAEASTPVNVEVMATHLPVEEATFVTTTPTRANRTTRIPRRRSAGGMSCREQREVVAAARKSRQWGTVLDLVAPNCWPTEDEVASLRAEAYAATQRWDACVAAGRGVTSARVDGIVRDCQRQANRLASAE